MKESDLPAADSPLGSFTDTSYGLRCEVTALMENGRPKADGSASTLGTFGQIERGMMSATICTIDAAKSGATESTV